MFQIVFMQSMIRTAIFGFAVHLVAIAFAAVPSEYHKKTDDWYRSEEGKRVADHVLSWQSANGSWPKNEDTASNPCVDEREKEKGTFDNGATTGELRLLARVTAVTNEVRYCDAFEKGFRLLLEAQYPTGGWPQRFPSGKGYARHITFNDGTMVRILELMREVATSEVYSFVDPSERKRAQDAFDRGIECIVKCQIIVDGKRTVWCAQHDEIDYQPRPARAYELVSLSGAESMGILKLLMSLENPSPEIKQAIESGVAWYESSKILGTRFERKNDDGFIVDDPNAKPLWARFYEVETNRPFFCGRDGQKKYNLSEVEIERRGGYGWYGNWGKDLAKNYAQWQQRTKPISPGN